MSESESDHGVGGFADPAAQEKNKRPWVKPVLTCETASRSTLAKRFNPVEETLQLAPSHPSSFGPS
jgi:hypothetical protein